MFNDHCAVTVAIPIWLRTSFATPMTKPPSQMLEVGMPKITPYSAASKSRVASYKQSNYEIECERDSQLRGEGVREN